MREPEIDFYVAGKNHLIFQPPPSDFVISSLCYQEYYHLKGGNPLVCLITSFSLFEFEGFKKNTSKSFRLKSVFTSALLLARSPTASTTW